MGQEEQEALASWVEVQGWRISKPGQTSAVHVVQTLLPPFEAYLPDGHVVHATCPSEFVCQLNSLLIW